jgi:hypothetical protein
VRWTNKQGSIKQQEWGFGATWRDSVK